MAVIRPVAGLPPGASFTAQVTDWFVVPVTMALNGCESPARTVIEDGVTLTLICGGGGEPPPAHPPTHTPAKVMADNHERLDMSHLSPPHLAARSENRFHPTVSIWRETIRGIIHRPAAIERRKFLVPDRM